MKLSKKGAKSFQLSKNRYLNPNVIYFYSYILMLHRCSFSNNVGRRFPVQNSFLLHKSVRSYRRIHTAPKPLIFWIWLIKPDFHQKLHCDKCLTKRTLSGYDLLKHIFSGESSEKEISWNRVDFKAYLGAKVSNRKTTRSVRSSNYLRIENFFTREEIKKLGSRGESAFFAIEMALLRNLSISYKHVKC